jgi:hypothetical protein
MGLERPLCGVGQILIAIRVGVWGAEIEKVAGDHDRARPLPGIERVRDT